MIRKADETLLEEIQAAYSVLDPVPAAVVAAGKAARTWIDPDAALAGLTADSALDPVPATRADGGHGGPGTRLLTFTAAELTVEIEAAEEGERRSVAGRVDPPVPAGVTIRWDGGDRDCAADEGGYFTADGIPPGLVSVELRLPDATTVVTSWVRV